MEKTMKNNGNDFNLSGFKPNKETTEKFKEELRKRRDELPGIIKGLEENDELLNVMLASNNYNMLKTVAERLDAWDVETVSEYMCAGCLDIVRRFIRENTDNLNPDAKIAVNNMFDRLKFLHKHLTAKESYVIPHQYNAIVENIQRIIPDKQAELAKVMLKTNEVALSRAKQALEGYKQVRLGE